MNDISDRHHRFVAHRQQADITRLQFRVWDDHRIKFKAAALIRRIAIRPIPLFARHLQRDVGLRYDQLLVLRQRQESSPAQLGRLHRNGISFFVEPENDVKEQAENEQADCPHNWKQNPIVKKFDLFLDGG
jgi:hypothetical protein